MSLTSKEEYLKRYLSGSDYKGGKKKRKKVTTTRRQGLTIIDNDVDFSSTLPADHTAALAAAEEAESNLPTVADVIDERPVQVQVLETYRESGKWKTLQNDSGSDGGSPAGKRHDSDSDQSPLRSKRHDSGSDQSPPRRHRQRHDSDQSPFRSKRHDSGSDQSPPRRHRQRHDSDQSPRRKARMRHDSDQSPLRKNIKTRHDSDLDQSPPRRNRKGHGSNQSPPGKHRKRHDSDLDQTPPRRNKKGHGSDQSPPRKHKTSNINADWSRKNSRRRNGEDSDQSPVRIQKRRQTNPDLSPPRNSEKKMTKTLGGAKAGLSSAKLLKEEIELLKRKEEQAFKHIDDDVLGKGAGTIFRDKSGRQRDLREEKRQKREEEAKKAEELEKYAEWGKGVRQQESQKKSLEETMHEMSKPLARYKDDKDLDDMLKQQVREDDPMASFLKKSTSKGPKRKSKPVYNGPAPAPNRFHILPGYRWDGVDRSSGFEKKFFEKQASNKAMADDSYKWSVEDM